MDGWMDGTGDKGEGAELVVARWEGWGGLSFKWWAELVCD